MNRGDCCGERLKGAKVFVGENHCGTLENPPQGKLFSVNCKAKSSFLKIQAAPKKYLHFCGLKVWALGASKTQSKEVAEDAEDSEGGANT